MEKIRYILIFTALILLLHCICCNEREQIEISDQARMIRYLESRYLPALNSVEVWENPYSEGLVIGTDHYEIYTTLVESLILTELPGYMESAFLAYQQQLNTTIENQNKFKIYLFGSRGEWESFTKDFTGNQHEVYLKIKAGGYYDKGACVTYNIGRERTFSVLSHEGWHQFNAHLSEYRLPSWLDEGVAMQFENSRFIDGRFRFEPRKNLYRLGPLKKICLTNRLMSLGQLISINPGEVLATDYDDAVSAYYAQSYALIRFLKEYKGGIYLPVYQRLMTDGFTGKWQLSGRDAYIARNRNIPLTVDWNARVGNSIFRNYVSKDIQTVQQEYFNFCYQAAERVRFK